MNETVHVATAPRLLARIDVAVSRALFKLPAGLLVALSRKPAVQIDGQTLHPEIQLLIAARKLRGGRALRDGTPQEARQRMHDEAMHYRVPPPPLKSVTDLTIPGAEGPLKARHYAPVSAGARPPLLVFFHGGGFVSGDLETHDGPCRELAHHAGMHVLAIDYRLAPEHPFPAAVLDGTAALRFALENAARLGADPSHVGVGGDSAGGNLAAVLAQLAVREQGPRPAFQLLIYPATDRTRPYPSQRLFATDLFLEAEDISWFDSNYTGASPELQRDLRVSPMNAPSLAGLCPAVVFTAAFDPLRDEGEAYAKALESAGVPTKLVRAEGMIHGFLNMGVVSGAARREVLRIAEMLRALACG